MFSKSELYESIMEFEPETESDKMIWQGLATKLYIDTEDKNSNKLFDVMEKAKRHNIIVPEPEMAAAWRFIKEHVEGKISSPEELEKLVLDYGLTTIASDTGSASI